MRVTDLRLEDDQGSALLSALVRSDREDSARRTVYRFEGLSPDQISAAGDAFVASLLVPSMYLSEDLIVEAPVSPTLLDNTRAITRLVGSWDPRYSQVQVLAPPASPPVRRAAGVGLFFSAGVDSFYALQKNITRHRMSDEAVTHLIYVHGYGTRDPYRPETMAKLADHMRGIADETGKMLVNVYTNLREGSRTPWRMHHGSALISNVLPLSPILGRCLIASSLNTEHDIPWGTHPQLDPLWSTDAIDIVHDGFEIARAEKVTTGIARFPLALRTLRVCWREEHQPKNCGRCRKCLNTMIALHSVDALKDCTAFNSRLAIRRVMTMNIEGKRYGAMKLVDMLGTSPYERLIRTGLRLAVFRSDLTYQLAKLLPGRRARSHYTRERETRSGTHR